MEIKLNDNLWLTNDNLNYVIGRKYLDKKNNVEKINGERFYQSAEHLVDDLVEERLINAEAKTVEEFFNSIKTVKKELTEILQKYV